MNFYVKGVDKLRDTDFSEDIKISTILLSFLNMNLNYWGQMCLNLDNTPINNSLDNPMPVNELSGFTYDEYIEYVLNGLLINFIGLPIHGKIIDNHNKFAKLVSLQDIIIDLVENIFIGNNSKYKEFPHCADIDCSIQYFEGKVFEYYGINNINDFCLFAISRLSTYNVHIIKCENCGDFFLPRSRTDEKYCDKIHENGRSCKEMGYENKIKSDQIMSEYRRVYKNKNAQKRRRAKKDPDAEAEFKSWVNSASYQRDRARDGEISFEEFKEWLKNN